MGYECLLVHDITFFVILLLGIFKGFESEVILKSYISGFPHLHFWKENVRVGKCPHERRLEKVYKFVAEMFPQTRYASLLA